MLESRNTALRIAPSLLSADFAQLGAEVRAIDQAGADWIHIDVMDGCFVPNITIGPLVVSAVRPHTQKLLDCHLMIDAPERYVEDFANAGADLITIHAEACRHLHRNLQHIRALTAHSSKPVQAGVSLNPHTPAESVLPVLHLCDVVLVMSVNPGFGGQKFLPEVREKIRALRKHIDQRQLPTLIEVDGGINRETAALVHEDGADVVVAGHAVFRSTHGKDYAAAMNQLRQHPRTREA